MLTCLSIRDLAVVKHLDLEWSPGFTALTGETGAGKSILLTALELGLGGRADADLVRDGAERAEVILEFDLTRAPAARQWLKDNALEEGTTCLIRRTVAGKGQHRAFINDRPVSLKALQALGQHLVEIHGQHAHLRLRQPPAQRQLLDLHAGHQERLAQLAELYRTWHACRERLGKLYQNAKDQALREEFLCYQIRELEAAAVETLDFNALLEEHTRLANLDKIVAGVQAQLHKLYDAEPAALDLVDQVARELASLSEFAPEFKEVAELVDSARIQLEEAGSRLRQRLGQLEADPARLQTLEQQLSAFYELARKHRVAPESLPNRLAQMRAELADLTGQEAQIAELKRQAERLEGRYRELAAELSARRRACAEGLAARITELMRKLGMPHGQFAIEVHTEPEAEPRPEGLDRVEFLVTTNPGQPLRPLAKVASGGELSRLSLAIQVACSEARAVPTLVFDEVDSGIGGGVAEVVGRHLRELGAQQQVLCVTHLPQVAAQAHCHHWVTKRTDGRETQTQVFCLTGEDRKREIARMLGGIKITAQTLAHAEEMLRWTE
nr:DNA repair protein RecN [uncultured Gammaproteobacteria bacterium]